MCVTTGRYVGSSFRTAAVPDVIGIGAHRGEYATGRSHIEPCRGEAARLRRVGAPGGRFRGRPGPGVRTCIVDRHLDVRVAAAAACRPCASAAARSVSMGFVTLGIRCGGLGDYRIPTAPSDDANCVASATARRNLPDECLRPGGGHRGVVETRSTAIARSRAAKRCPAFAALHHSTRASGVRDTVRRGACRACAPVAGTPAQSPCIASSARDARCVSGSGSPRARCLG